MQLQIVPLIIVAAYLVGMLVIGSASDLVPLRAIMAARCPPADQPETTIREPANPSAAACSRSQRNALRISSRIPARLCSGASV